MKRSFVSFALCFLFVAALLCSFVSCDSDKITSEISNPQTSNVSSEALHTHEWGEWTVITEATCLAEGKSERACACGEKEAKATTASHMGDEWVIDREATLREEGKRHKVCSFCNETYLEEAIPRIAVTRLEGITDKQQEKYRPSYKLANCRNLSGKPVVVAIFIDDNESFWTANEAVKFTDEQIVPALEFLEKSAQNWSVGLEFELHTYSTELSDYEIKYEGIVNTNAVTGNATKDVLIHAANDIGCESDWDLYSYYKSIYPENDIIFLCFLDKPGRSYARPAVSTGYCEFSEEAVIFSDSTGNIVSMRKYASRSSTIAHEILHLFGAEDYYEPRDREILARRYYPSDIMLYQYEDISRNSIGKATAYYIGWTGLLPDPLIDPRWQS